MKAALKSWYSDRAMQLRMNREQSKCGVFLDAFFFFSSSILHSSALKKGKMHTADVPSTRRKNKIGQESMYNFTSTSPFRSKWLRANNGHTFTLSRRIEMMEDQSSQVQQSLWIPVVGWRTSRWICSKSFFLDPPLPPRNESTRQGRQRLERKGRKI